MKKYLPLLLLCLTSFAPAQYLLQSTWVTNPLNAHDGHMLQWGIVTGPPSAYFPAQQEKKQKPWCSHNCAMVQTVNGVSQLFVTDSHDFCAAVPPSTSNCSYLGSFVEFHQELVTEGIAHFWRVSIGLTGTFTSPLGVVTQNVPARYYFETFPSQDSTDVPSGGNLTVVFELN